MSKITNALPIKGAGVTVTTALTSSAAIALPVLQNTEVARFIRAVTTSGNAYIKIGTSGVGSATSADILINTIPTLINVAGNSHFTHIQETAATTINLIPIETS